MSETLDQQNQTPVEEGAGAQAAPAQPLSGESPPMGQVPSTATPLEIPSPEISPQEIPAEVLLSAEVPSAARPQASRAYRCQCGRPVFFRNSQCLACQTPLGFDPPHARLLPLQPGPTEGTWLPWDEPDGAPLQRCANFHTASGCNWMVPVRQDGSTPSLCQACLLTRTIPDQSVPINQQLWTKVEMSKRRLVSQLILLGLPVVPLTEDPRGLAFDLLGAAPGGPRVMTGHANGVITVNIEEADDAVREKVRAAMREPYRTLLGHFRHEIGHYYWDRLVRDGPWLEDFRTLFGDERQDYAGALRLNYEQGPPADWQQRFVSSYASTHPWEDWAETWAHYLHMADTVDTAVSFGVNSDNVDLEHEPFGVADLWQPDAPDATQFLEFINGWVRLTAVFNELSRSMGQPDFYPFAMPRATVGKLQFIHRVVTGAAAVEVVTEQASGEAQPDVAQAPALQPLA
ncbi:zinc-binding metallopeptidase family protein [Variovorax sp. VNK109]|uniref:zinc-binding metallopeptidase family protein n=1 Tax=Variovorax sp. VNK109 TaxID=3400919 RepID=UPI003BFB4671